MLGLKTLIIGIEIVVSEDQVMLLEKKEIWNTSTILALRKLEQSDWALVCLALGMPCASTYFKSLTNL